MRNLYKALFCSVVFSCLFLHRGWAQNCTSFPAYFPDTVCQGQGIKGKNLGPATSSYSWDVCGGDLFRTPTLTPLTLTGVGSSNGLKVVKVGAKYYGFLASVNSNNLIRLDFDTSLANTPTVINLGNPGGSITGGAGFELEQDGSNYFGFTFNRQAGQLIRYQFGADITSTPTATVLAVPGTTNSYGMDLVKDGSSYFAFVSAFNSNKLFVLSFGNSLASTPTVSSLTLPSSSYVAVLGVVDCSGRYVFVSDVSTPSKILKLKFATSFADVPTIATINLTGGYSSKPTSLTAATDGGRSVLLVGSNSQTGGIGLLNFGNTFATDAPAMSTSLGALPLGALGMSDVFYKTNGEAVMIYTTDNSVHVGRLTFPNACPSISGSVTGYQPPVFSFSQPGKYFINYVVTDNLGKTTRFGDSIVVKSTVASGPGLDLDFMADEQCPSHATKFYPQINPSATGTYLWTYPGNTTSSGVIGSHTFAAPGTYPVTMYFRPTDGCGSGSITKPVKIFANPTAAITSNFTLPAKICTKDSILFLDASTPAASVKRWKWDFGNGQTAFTQNGKAYYTATGPVSVKLTASDSSGCGTPATKPVTPEAGADVDFSSSKVCLNDQAQFQNLTPVSPGITYLWNFGDVASGANNTSTSADPTVAHLFSDTGSFQVKLRAVTTSGCTSQVNKPFRVYPLPKANFGFPFITFFNSPISFTNLSQAQGQTIQNSLWNFGDPGSGLSDTSTLTHPVHTYQNSGPYSVKLEVTSNLGCKADTTLPVFIYTNCPQVSFTKSGPASGNYDTTYLNNQTNLVKTNQIDFCAGDLEQTPILQSQTSGTSPINQASQVIPVLDGDQWMGFIPAQPGVGNATSFFKAKFGTSLNNDIGYFGSDLGNPANSFGNPNFIRFFKEDTVWYGIATNNDNKLYRLRFGSSLDNIPSVMQIPLPANTLSSPQNAVIAKDKDSIYVFIVNNNNAIINNVIRLRFEQTLLDTPDVFVLNNPPALQNSNGFFSINLIRECDQWIGLLISNSQLYRLTFGFSLNRIPSVTSISSEVTAGLPVNVFNNLRGVTMLRDMGKIYALINTNAGGIFRIRFGNGLQQPIDQVSSLGSFGISGFVGQLSFVQQNSEVFGLGINNTGTVYKFKFPNRCSASTQFATHSGPSNDTTQYQQAGKYYITVTSESPFGTIVQKLDSVEIGEKVLAKTCKTMTLNHKKPICYDYKIKASVGQAGLSNVKWDFCTGDFKLAPANLAIPQVMPLGGINCIQTVLDDGNYYSFVAAANGFYRLNLGSNPAGPPAQVSVAIPQSPAYSGLQDFRLFKEGNNWFALCTFINGESVVRLNFGPSLTNNAPSASAINLTGLLKKCRAIDLFEDHGNKYAIVANQDENSVVILDFGTSYINIPRTNSFTVSPAVNLLRVSMIRDCNLWHAFVSDEKLDSVYQLIFTKGLNRQPTLRKHFVSKPRGLVFVKDGGEFFGFITREHETNPQLAGQLMRFQFGSSLDNLPLADELGTFTGGTPSIGLNRVTGLQIIQNQKSEHYLFGGGSLNGVLYRIGFQNPCAAEKPIASGDTVFNQSYLDRGKFFFSASGFDENGDEVSGNDNVLVLQPVVASIALEGSRCVGSILSFKDNSIYDGIDPALNKYEWNYGDPTTFTDTSNAQFPTYAYNQPGSYPVKLKVEVNTGCINEAEYMVRIVGKPKVDFTFGSGTICTNDSILFQDATVTDQDTVVSWNWVVKKGTDTIATSSKSNPRFLFSETGSYAVSLSVTGKSNCDSTVTKLVNVGTAGALVSFTNPSPCLNESVLFTSSITLPSGVSQDSVSWFLEGSKVSNQSNLSYQFSSTGFYTIRLVVNTAGCANSFSKTFKVSEKPSFNIEAPSTLQCQNLPQNFNISGLTSTEAVTYHWDFGDNTTDTLPNPTKTFATAATFMVKLKVETDNGCFTEKSVQFTTKLAPKAQFSLDKSCKDEPVAFTNESSANGIPGGITSYFWEFDDPVGTTSTSPNPPPLTYSVVDTSITIKLTVRTSDECPNTFEKKIQIGQKLNASFEKEIGCIGTPFKFYDKSRGDLDPDPVVAWSWSIGGFPFNVKDPVVQFDLVGVFDVRLEVQSQGGCRAVINASNDFVVNNAVQTDFNILDNSFTGDSNFRVRIEQTLNPSLDYFWDFGDSTTSTAVSPVHFYKKEGTYVITLTAVRSGTICSTLVQKVVNVVVNPVAGIKLEKVLAGTQNGNLLIGAELVNESNISLSNLNLQAQIGNLLTINEKWTGILLPNGRLNYTFNSNIARQQSQNVPFVCVKASIPTFLPEITPGNNSGCVTVDTLPSLVSLYPNPTTDHLNIEANLPTTDPVEIKIYDQLSHEVYGRQLEITTAGVLKSTIPLSGFPQGIYYLTMKVGTDYEHRKFIISR